VTNKCLIGLYIPLLLNTGFGFANDSQHIYVVDKIAGEKPGIASQLIQYIYNFSDTMGLFVIFFCPR